jgi:hypothetical protein
MKMLGKYPAVVTSYAQNPRQCRVSIPGITDGAQVMPEAEIMYPIGDKANTEIEILQGDPVWVEFEAGDERYPIIVGYRNKNTGNSNDWRRWHHKNVELLADLVIHLDSDTLVIDAATSVTVNTPRAVVNADERVTVNCGTADIEATGDVTVTTAGEATVTAAADMTLTSATLIAITAPDVSINGS